MMRVQSGVGKRSFGARRTSEMGGKRTRALLASSVLLNRILYVAFVALLALSPILSLIISDLVGLKSDELNFWPFLWVGPVLSLPLTLLVARAFGPEVYLRYWAYLESFPYNSKAVIMLSWAGIVGFTSVIGIVTIFMGAG